MELERELQTVRNVIEEVQATDLPLETTEPAEQLASEVATRVESLETDQALSEIFGFAALHPNAHFRYYMLDVAREHSDNVFAQEFIMDMTHDDEDYIGFAALRLLGELGLQRALDDLMSFIGPPSERLDQPKGKVGVGGSTVLNTHFQLFGTEDPDELSHLEDYLKEYGHLPEDRLSKPYPYLTVNPENADPDEDDYWTVDEEPPEGMVQIPGGTYTIGIDRSDLPENNFEVGDFTRPYTVEIDPFYIDRHPVTNEEYDEFVDAIEETDHKYCHPGEPEDKDHRRNTLHDDRVGPDHPVAGIDWYDAYAYAKWAGKDIPIEEEWEIAARGTSGNVFPWGDTFDPDRLNWAGRSFDEEFDSWGEWQDVIYEADRMEGIPSTITTPVDEFPEGASEFGVMDMVGNVWEYTKTNYYSRQEMFPVFGHGQRKAHTNLIEGPDAFPTTRGGTWSSIPEMTTTVYRSSDLMTDRHNEIGFRCVKRIDQP